MEIPTDRTLTLYQSRQRGRLYWYVTWHDDAGKRCSQYIGRKLTPVLQAAYVSYQSAFTALQATIKVEITRKQRQAQKGA